MRFFKTTASQILFCFTATLMIANSTAICLASEPVATKTEELRWQYRLLFLKAKTQSTKKLILAWQSEHQQALAERKLLILHHKLDALWTVENGKQHATCSNQKIANAICSNCMVLVGLDGSIKSRDAITPDNLDKLFDLIDAMPMRRAELREKDSH